MKKLIYLSIISGALLLNGCSKEELLLCKEIRTVLNDRADYFNLYKFDDLNRVIEFKEESSSNIGKIEYTGLSGKEEERTSSESLVYSSTLAFDTQNRLKSYKLIENNFSYDREIIFSFVYNSSGYLTNITKTIRKNTGGLIEILNFEKDSLIYEKGNLSKKIIMDSDGNVVLTKTFTYYKNLNKANLIHYKLSPINSDITYGFPHLIPLLGKRSNNLVKEIVETNASGTRKYAFDYVLDEKGLVEEYNFYYTNTASVTTTTNNKISYTCD